jgi:hypothetical protein
VLTRIHPPSRSRGRDRRRPASGRVRYAGSQEVTRPKRDPETPMASAASHGTGRAPPAESLRTKTRHPAE